MMICGIEPRGQRKSDFSRLEMTVQPHSPLHVVELTAKGTIHNKEVFNRSHFERVRKTLTWPNSSNS